MLVQLNFPSRTVNLTVFVSRGQKLSNIEYVRSTDKGDFWPGVGPFWVIQSLKDESLRLATATTEFGFFIGRRKWTVLEGSICSQQQGTELELTISTCDDSQFTCADATCIRLE